MVFVSERDEICHTGRVSNSGSGKNGEVVSLEDLLKSDAKSASADGVSPTIADDQPASPPKGSVTYQNPMDADLARVDALLDAEDPTFIAKVQELRKERISGDIESDSFDDDIVDSLERKKAKDTPPPPKPDGPGLKGLIGATGRRLKSYFSQAGGAAAPPSASATSLAAEKPKAWGKAAVEGLKQTATSSKGLVKNVKEMPLSLKLAYAGLAAFMVLLGLVVTLLSGGRLLPDFEIKFVPTVAAGADHAWTIGGTEEWDDFYSPLRHPEHVILLDKVVVNLKKSESSDENPMGYFEFYLELNSREAAVETSDRMSEISDAVQRTAEAITYDEIITPAGKNKLKLVIRKNVNTILTQGRVRKVFYKSVVIKP